MAHTARQTITPKKIEFDDQKPTNRSVNKEVSPNPQPSQANNIRGKSFLAMISPIKNRSSSALEERNNPNENDNKSKSGIKGGKV